MTDTSFSDSPQTDFAPLGMSAFSIFPASAATSEAQPEQQAESPVEIDASEPVATDDLSSQTAESESDAPISEAVPETVPESITETSLEPEAPPTLEAQAASVPEQTEIQAPAVEPELIAQPEPPIVDSVKTPDAQPETIAAKVTEAVAETVKEVAQPKAEKKDGFAALGLSDDVLLAVTAQGYTVPTPIQAQVIPYLLAGEDVLGQAQTGTGKTAAFALPLLTTLDPHVKKPQVLVLAPTRELAIQVSEAFSNYAAKTPLNVATVYGGQSYEIQLRQLRRGPQVVVGTPGRVMDHMRKGSLKLDNLVCLVLDEADEMLKMGFIDDVEWVLEHTPDEHQMALFSATMPREIRRLAQTYMHKPVEVMIKQKTLTASTIEQSFWLVRGIHKTTALIRILEGEDSEGVIVFVKTKADTVVLADELMKRGFSATALNGDMPQNLREQTVERLKSGLLDILVATDVAARGLDVERISHVVNYDMPHDSEVYTHRVGRTGRAGRSGKAILFVRPREQHALKSIEKRTGQPIASLTLPTAESVNQRRIQKFQNLVTETLRNKDLGFFKHLLKEYVNDNEVAIEDVAAALAVLQQGDKPLVLPPDPPEMHAPPPSERLKRRTVGSVGGSMGSRKMKSGGPRNDAGLIPYRVEVGRKDDLRPGQLVGAIANEAGLDSAYIGRIKLFDSFTIVDLPEEMEAHLSKSLSKTQINGRLLKLKRDRGGSSTGSSTGSFTPGASRSPSKKFSKDAGFSKDRSQRRSGFRKI